MHDLMHEARENARYDRLTTEAYERGADHGRAAASWYFDGNTPREEFRRVLDGIIDVDPAIFDTFPTAPLSGEFAGDATPWTLADDLGVSRDDELLDELCNFYEDGFGVAVADEIERACRAQLDTNEGSNHA